jgi:HAD superfamily hydrolase (TIGR01509 family)
MSLNRACPDAPLPVLADSAAVLGTAWIGAGAVLAQGTIVRSHQEAVSIGNHSAVLENAVEVVRELAGQWPLGLASSANRPIIDLVLERSGMMGCFRTTVSSEEVARGKPAPDVYLEAAARLGVPPERCAAVEDSANGLRSAAAAGMWVVAVPNRRYPPPGELVQAADLVLTDLRELSPAAIQGLGSGS